MALGYLYTYQSGELVTLYTFNAIESIGNWNLDASSSLDDMQLPGSLDSIVFDGKSRNEDFTFTFVALPTTYNSATPGTGTFLDQLCDIFYLLRNQGAIIQNADTGAEFFWFAIAFHSNATLNASHDTSKSEPTLTTGFQNGSSTYGMKCAIKNVTIKEIDVVQKHVTISVTLRRVGKVYGYG